MRVFELLNSRGEHVKTVAKVGTGVGEKWASEAALLSHEHSACNT